MRYNNFPQAELKCPCGCDGEMSHEFMRDVVVPMRSELGFSFIIPRGGAYRCAEYDGKVNGAHQGHALDVLTNSRQRYKILNWLFIRNHNIEVGNLKGKKVTRMGINNGSIHFDDRDSGKSTYVIWDYY